AYRGVPTAPFACVETQAELERLRLPFPVFVKPVAEGSGKGVFSNNLCDTPARLRERALFLLERYAEPVLVETYLPGPEFTASIASACRTFSSSTPSPESSPIPR